MLHDLKHLEAQISKNKTTYILLYFSKVNTVKQKKIILDVLNR